MFLPLKEVDFCFLNAKSGSRRVFYCCYFYGTKAKHSSSTRAVATFDERIEIVELFEVGDIISSLVELLGSSDIADTSIRGEAEIRDGEADCNGGDGNGIGLEVSVVPLGLLVGEAVLGISVGCSIPGMSISDGSSIPDKEDTTPFLASL